MQPVSGEAHIRKVEADELEEVWRVHVAASHAAPQTPGWRATHGQRWRATPTPILY
jgi:hypothetical protein